MKLVFLFPFLFYFSHFTLGIAGDDLFQTPSNALQTTKYASDCGKVSEDISPDMPPVDNQKQTNWCATFTAKALIEYEMHKANPGSDYSKRLSAVDLNTWESGRPKDSRGKFIGVDSGTDVNFLLEGAQEQGRLYSESDYPLDQALFDNANLIRRLSNYYQTEKIYADKGALECRDLSPDNQSLELMFSSLTSILGKSTNEVSFLSNIVSSYSNSILPKPKATKMEIKPPYNIRKFIASSGDELAEELQKNLLMKRPTSMGICADQMLLDPKLIGNLVPPPRSDTCGSHAIIVTGMKVIDGVCQVEIRSSWGTAWPSTKDGGYAWMPLTQLLKIIHPLRNGQEPMMSISSSLTGQKITNQYIDDEKSYTGSTWQGQFVGNGIFRGKFSDGSAYIGEMTDGRPNGNGRLESSDGSISDGTFVNGQLVSGYYKGILTNGWLYDGPYVNGHTTSQGKLTPPSQ